MFVESDRLFPEYRGEQGRGKRGVWIIGTINENLLIALSFYIYLSIDIYVREWHPLSNFEQIRELELQRETVVEDCGGNDSVHLRR